jgi:hypothetical protein
MSGVGLPKVYHKFVGAFLEENLILEMLCLSSRFDLLSNNERVQASIEQVSL